MKIKPLTIDPRDQKLGLKALETMIYQFSDFKAGLASHCHLRSTAAIDQWIKRGIPESRLFQFWEFYDLFVSELTNNKIRNRGKKTG